MAPCQWETGTEIVGIQQGSMLDGGKTITIASPPQLIHLLSF